MTETSSQDITQLEGDAELARPYARALFELAKDQNQMQRWGDTLGTLAAVVSNDTMRSLLDNPGLSRADAGALVIRACGDDLEAGATNLLNMLAENGRLSQLPMIAALYNQFRDEAEGLLEAEVISAQPLSDDAADDRHRLGQGDLPHLVHPDQDLQVLSHGGARRANGGQDG